MGQNYDYLDKIRTSYSGYGAYSRRTDQNNLSNSLSSLGRAQESLQEMRTRTGIEGSIAEQFKSAADIIDKRFESLNTKVTRSQDNADLAVAAMRDATNAVDALPPEGVSPFAAARELGVDNVYSIMGGGIHFPDDEMEMWQANLVEEAREKEAAIARERFDNALSGITFADPSTENTGGPATRAPGGTPPGGGVAPPSIAPPETGVPVVPPPGGGGSVLPPPDLDLPGGPQPPSPPTGPYDPPVTLPDDPGYDLPQPTLPPPGGDNPYNPPDVPGEGPGNDGPWVPGGPGGPGIEPWDPDQIGGGGDQPGGGSQPDDPSGGGGSGTGGLLPGVAGGAALGGAGLLAARGLGGGGLAGMSGAAGMPGAAGMGGRAGAGMVPGSGLTGPGGAGAGGAGAGAGAAGARGGTTAMVGGQGAAAGGSRGGAAMAPGGMGGAGGRGSDKKRRRKLGLQALQLEAEETDVALGPEGGAGVRDSAAAPAMDTDDLL